MIYDHIKNIGLYKGLSPALDEALTYIETVTPDVEVGTHPLELGVKAVVSEGITSLVNPKGYEAHRKYADVQLALVGTELIRCKPLPQVSETIPYDEAKDAARYADCPGTFITTFFTGAGMPPGAMPGSWASSGKTTRK